MSMFRVLTFAAVLAATACASRTEGETQASESAVTAESLTLDVMPGVHRWCPSPPTRRSTPLKARRA